jgi:hypothetical protein
VARPCPRRHASGERETADDECTYRERGAHRH